MIERSYVITQLETAGYPVKVSMGTQPEPTEEGFQVGYLLTHTFELEKLLRSNILHNQASEQVQGFEIFLIAKVTSTEDNYPTIWKAMYAALGGWIPYPNEYNLSGMIHVTGQIVGISNGFQVTREIWYLPFQTQTPMQA